MTEAAAPTPLARALAARIARAGPIGVDAWMAACLADPDHGYYRTRQPIGRDGDFITAPEISQIFGELIGAWAATVWAMLGRPAPLRLVELGPGRGTLMADLLRATARPAPDFLAAIDLHLVEIDPSLRALQRAAIGRDATWHAELDGVPDGPAIVIANEFLDALPVRQILRCAEGWCERRVGLADERFVFVAGPPLLSLPGHLTPAQRAAPQGAIVELPEAAQALVARLAARLARAGGAALFVDYGPAIGGVGDTLQALRQHRFVDPLAMPGAVDLTAHVDFAALAAAARGAGAGVWGPVPQAVLLTRLGLHARAAMLARGATPAARRALEAACARLIAPAQMGTLFKALALTQADIATPPPGFDPPPMPG